MLRTRKTKCIENEFARTRRARRPMFDKLVAAEREVRLILVEGPMDGIELRFEKRVAPLAREAVSVLAKWIDRTFFFGASQTAAVNGLISVTRMNDSALWNEGRVRVRWDTALLARDELGFSFGFARDAYDCLPVAILEQIAALLEFADRFDCLLSYPLGSVVRSELATAPWLTALHGNTDVLFGAEPLDALYPASTREKHPELRLYPSPAHLTSIARTLLRQEIAGVPNHDSMALIWSLAARAEEIVRYASLRQPEHG